MRVLRDVCMCNLCRGKKPPRVWRWDCGNPVLAGNVLCECGRWSYEHEAIVSPEGERIPLPNGWLWTGGRNPELIILDEDEDAIWLSSSQRGTTYQGEC